MNPQEITEHIIDLAKKHGAEFCEVVVVRKEFVLKRIKQGQVDQPPAGEQWEIDLALVKNNRRQSVSFDNPSFAKEIIEKTLSRIDLLPEQETAIPSEIFPRTPQPAALYDQKTAELDGRNLIDMARKINQALDAQNLALSGKIAQAWNQIAYGNSVGTIQTCQCTLATAACFAFDKDNPSISAYASSGGVSVDQIETERFINELTQKCVLARGKEKIDLFGNKQDGEDLKIDVIAEPYFFGPIFQFLGFFGFNGLFVERGESFISDKIGKQVMGANITIKDDPVAPEHRGMGFPFDFEGRPRTALSLIEHGVAKNALYDNELARKWNKQPTGNALSPSQRSEGAAPFNLLIEGGGTSVEEMIKHSQKPTLWVTKVHYLGMKHFQTATMTGVAQHGVFLVENGEVIAPVENLRFEESIPEALKRVEAMSKPTLDFDPLSLGAAGGIVLPAMKIRDFRFVGSTKRTV